MLDALRADAIFAWRQLRKHPITSAAAILSLALALGACTAAFRLIDAMLLRPLPVAGADRLRIVARQGLDPGGHFRIGDSFEYPLFARMRTAAKGQAELIAISYSDRADLTFGADDEMEKAYRQYVSGWMFDAFGLRPASGRLLTTGDDDIPGAHAYAVLSYDYWTGRFARDPAVVGRSFRMGGEVYQIVGVAPPGFTGTEPGVSIDVLYQSVREPLTPTAYVPFSSSSASGAQSAATFIVRTSTADPLAMASQLRLEVPRGRPEFRVRDIRSQEEIDLSQGVRERLLATLAMFFAAVALLLTGIGLYGVLHSTVVQRRREIGIRRAIGAGAGDIARRLLREVGGVLFAGAVVGLALGVISARYFGALLYDVRPTDVSMLLVPGLTMLVASILAALPPLVRAARINPIEILRAE